MEKYKKIVKQILSTYYHFLKANEFEITEIKFRDYGINVYYKYTVDKVEYTSNDQIKNSELNAYIYENIN